MCNEIQHVDMAQLLSDYTGAQNTAAFNQWAAYKTEKKKMRLTNNYEIMQIVHLGRHFYHLYVNEHLPSELYFKWTFAAT